MQNKHAFIFFGASGSGKGTQAELLQKHLETIDTREVVRIETGKRFRALAKHDSYVGRLSAEIMNVGGLQPEFLSVWNWTEAFMHYLDENEHLILDGSPRQRSEPPILETAFDFFGYKDVHIIFLNVDDVLVKDRMLNRARIDDKAEKIDTRLAWFREQVLVMVDYFRNNDRYHFHEIDGSKSVEEVHQSILAAMKL